MAAEGQGAVAIRADSPRWNEINASQYAHERIGLQEVRDLLPDAEPYCAWANVEFVGTDGSVNEVDLLVLTPSGLHLIELKHWAGEVSGSGIQWQRHLPTGRVWPIENPLLLATRKAKRLRSLLDQYVPKMRSSLRAAPYVNAAVYLHARDTRSKLDQVGRQHVYGPRNAPKSGLPDIGSLLLGSSGVTRIERVQARDIVRLIKAAGVEPAGKNHTLGPLLLDPRPFAEGPGWKDYRAEHQMQSLVRRVRVYLTVRAEPAQRDMIARAAQREFRILQDISHDGIVRAVDFAEHGFGPAVIFEYDEEAVRLDRWIAEHGSRLGIEERLDLVRQLAETMRYAHSRRLVHRALNPHSIMVRRPDSNRPRLVVIDWQTGAMQPGTSQSGPGTLAGTTHLDELADEPARTYLAPEAGRPGALGVLLDVFALGAVAYLIFTGRPPAATVAELLTRLTEADGLDVSAGFDAAPTSLVDLIYEATQGDASQRTASVAAFLTGLDKVEEELTAPDPEPQLDPLEAREGDVLEGGLTVLGRLGSGATAVALKVRRADAPSNGGRRDNSVCVLKVARDQSKRDRLVAEAEELGRLNHWQIARLLDGPMEVGGHTALLLEFAGEPTLADELGPGRRLNLELLERYGNDLLDIVRALDAQGVTHRDIKPANLAARPRLKDNEKHLTIFDFSLASVPAEQWQAGTEPYRDPFLGPPRRIRYDAAAERFSVAVTLYEMATGVLPRWGDGIAHPAQTDVEVTVDGALFDPSVAAGLATFFATALARDVRHRHDTLEEMADAWRSVFTALPPPSVEPVVGPAVNVTGDTPIDAVGLTPKARSALERFGVHTVGELIGHDAMALARLGGVSKATKGEISRRAKELAALLGERATQVGPQRSSAATEPAPPEGVERLMEIALAPPGRTGRGAQTNDARALRLLLGVDPPAEGADPLRWPSQTEVAKALGVTAQRVGQILNRAAQRWLAQPELSAVCDEIAALLEANGGVMSAAELAEELIAAHGAYSLEPWRTSEAIGLVRAAAGAEMLRGGAARIDVRQHGLVVLVGLEPAAPDATDTAADLLEYAVGLGRIAQRLAAADPLPTPSRAIERLRQPTPPPALAALTDDRLLALAAAAGGVAVNANQQLYPVGLDARTALRLAAGTLAVARGRTLTVGDIRKRVRARFPRAADLPDRPELDRLLRECGVALEWTGDRYAPLTAGGSDAFSTATRFGTMLAVLLPTTPEAVSDTDERLAGALDRHGFLAALVRPAGLAGARRALLARLAAAGVVEVDVTRILVATLREIGVPWQLIVDSDARDRTHPDWRNLEHAVRHAVLPRITAALEAPKPVLITEAAPLARYSCMDLLGRLADNATPRPAARLLLAPVTAAKPVLDDQPIPVTSPAQLLWLADVWWQAIPNPGKAPS